MIDNKTKFVKNLQFVLLGGPFDGGPIISTKKRMVYECLLPEKYKSPLRSELWVFKDDKGVVVTAQRPYCISHLYKLDMNDSTHGILKYKYIKQEEPVERTSNGPAN